ncbi:hypothetical protein E4Z66_05365 [Aliishimia ponticola]|uniref:DUF5333 domain-containing protein n=1 Tax=Aliishimia ponticola TaxID=2499833 RepID=A0A4S4NL15_9RHOB|nr:DUF5333 domain-containing protein [Aliishimia ponticola]THH38988.1 hypothetical protein E4Z66_05365 [Aliishimia ponticola]
MRFFVVSSLVCAVAAGSVAAKPSLRDVDPVENGLFAIAVADKIRNECDAISGRVLKAMRQLSDLQDYAVSIGYSKDEIKSYVRSDAEKRRMEAKRDAYLTTLGVVKSDPATYCAAGRAEIEKSSRIGALLRAR